MIAMMTELLELSKCDQSPSQEMPRWMVEPNETALPTLILLP